jgi:predicted transcriptional regulator
MASNVGLDAKSGLDWRLGYSELVVFKALCGSSSAGKEGSDYGEKPEYGKGLASRLSVPESVVSRALNSLAEKKLVVLSRDGKRKSVVVSDAPHALALTAFFAARPYFDARLLAFSSVRVLSGLLFPNSSVARVKRVSFLPEITVRRVLSKLLDAGVVGRRGSSDYFILMPELEKAVCELVSFAVTQARNNAGGITAGGSLVVRGPFGFLRTSAVNESIPRFAKPTGLSVLNEFGVRVIQTDFKDYYYNVFGVVGKPSLEEAVVHVLLRSTLSASAREASYALLALQKNKKKVNAKKLLVAASDLGVEQVARQALDFVDAFTENREIKWLIGEDFPRVEGPVFPSFEEFKELVKQYG